MVHGPQTGLRAVASSDVPYVAPADAVSERRGAAGLLLPAPPATGVLAWVRAAALTIGVPPDVLAMTDNFMVEGQTLPPHQSAPLGR